MKYFAALKLFSVLSLFLGVLVGQNAYAQAPSCLFPDKAINLYGQNICPDRFNLDDNFKRWNAMVGRLDRILPGALEGERKPASEVCNHVDDLRRKYSGSTENYIFLLQSGLMQGARSNPDIMAFVAPFMADPARDPNDAPADLFILKMMNDADPAVMKTLLSFYPQEMQMQILMVQNFIETSQHLSTLYDSVLDTCFEHARENKMYKVLNYNGPDADYDPDQDPGWDVLREKWKRNKELGIVE